MNDYELNQLRIRYEEAKKLMGEHIARRSGDLEKFKVLSENLLDAERKLALSSGDEAAVPWDAVPAPYAYSVVKISDVLRTIVIYPLHRVSQSKSPETVIVDFGLCLASYYGLPNDEAIRGHSLYGKGLQCYGAFKVANSKWIAELEVANRVHPNHKREHFAAREHYILAFPDQIFEAVARNVSIEIVACGMKDAIGKATSLLRFPE